MRVCPERHFSLPLDQLSETRIPSEVGPHHQRVDEEADQPLNLSPRPVRDRRPDADVLLPAVPHQERLEGRHQRHEHRRPFPPTEIPQALAQLFTELYLLLPPAPSYRGGKEKVELGKELSEGLRNLSRREGATMFMTLMAAFKTLLMRYSGEEDISVGTAIANRTRREVEGLIGFFVNTLVMRTDLGGNPSFRELIKREREVALGAYTHQEMPFEKLVEEINPERDLSRSPLFQVMISLHNTDREEFDLSGLKVTEVGEESGPVKFDLTLELTEGEEGISGCLEYSLDLYEAETIRRMARHYERLVNEIVWDAEQRIREIELLSDAEKRRLIEEWNETERDYGAPRLVHEMIADQAERGPEAI